MEQSARRMSNPRVVAGFRRVAIGAALFSVAVAAMVLFGWWLGSEPMKSVLPGQATMKINTAIGLGTFLAQFLLRQPLQSATTQQFHITGSWADPQVDKVVK